MNYIGKRLNNQKYKNSVLIYTSDGYLLEPFYGRQYTMPFDFGISSFASIHLAISILANIYNISVDDKNFLENMKDIILRFHNDIICSLDKDDFVLNDYIITRWLEKQLSENNEPEEDIREIELIIHDIIEPNY